MKRLNVGENKCAYLSDLTSKQNQLTSANAGDKITITGSGANVKVNANTDGLQYISEDNNDLILGENGNQQANNVNVKIPQNGSFSINDDTFVIQNVPLFSVDHDGLIYGYNTEFNVGPSGMIYTGNATKIDYTSCFTIGPISGNRIFTAAIDAQGQESITLKIGNTQVVLDEAALIKLNQLLNCEFVYPEE